MSITVCGPVARAVSADQIFAAASPMAFQNPSLYPGLMTRSVARTPASIALTVTKYTADGVSIGTGIESFLKSQSPTVGNATTYQRISIIAGAAGIGLQIMQPILQGDVNTQQATITAGVQAALMTDADIYNVPVGGCAANPHRMFYATGASGALKGIIP